LSLAPLFLAIALPCAARAATLDDCFQDALKQSETMAESKEAIYQARELYRQAIGAVLPQVAVNYTAYTGNSNIAEFNPENQQLSVSLVQPLFRGFAEFAALRDEKDLLASSKDADAWAAMQLYQDVSQAFFMVLSLEHSRKLIDEEIKQYDGRIKEEKHFYAIGRARNSDVETTEADQALLAATGVLTDEQIAVERQVLAFLTGKDPGEKLEAADPVPDSPGNLHDLLKGLDARPDIHAAYRQNEAAKELVQVAHGAHWPSVNFLADWYPAANANRNDSIDNSNANVDWDAGIAATMPLFEGFTLVSKDRQASSVQRQAQLNLDLQRRQDASTLRSAWNTMAGDIDQVRAYDRGYKLSYKAYRDLDQDYRNGLDTNEDVLIAMTASWVAKQSLETAKFTARNDYEQLQTLAGNRLDLYQGQNAQ
jgi:outer membrane protein TolC